MPSKPPSKTRGGRAKKETPTEEKQEEVQSKKGSRNVKSLSNNNGSTSGNRKATKPNKCEEAKGKNKKDDEKNKKEEKKGKKNEITKDESVKQTANGKKQTSRNMTNNGLKGRGRAGKPKPDLKKDTGKTPRKGARRRGKAVDSEEDDETQSEKAKSSAHESEEEDEEEKNNDDDDDVASDSVSKPAETNTSAEELSEGETKTDGEVQNESEEEQSAEEQTDSKVKEESEERVSSGDEDEPEKVPPDADQESPPEASPSGPVKVPAPMKGQKTFFKSKLLQKKMTSKAEEPRQDSAPAKEADIKGKSPSKSAANKGKSQILQLASKAKSTKTEETSPQVDQNVSSPKEHKGLLSKQSRLLFMKGKGKVEKSKAAVEDPPDDSAHDSAEEQQQSGLAEMVPKDAEEVADSEPKEQFLGKKKGIRSLRRVSGWIQKKMPKSIHFQKKISAVTQAIGISKWLPSLTSKRRKKSLIRHKMVMKMAGGGKSKKKNNKEEASNLEKTTEDPPGGISEDPADIEEQANSGDAKYAIVFPRMNKMGKSKDTTTDSPSTSTVSTERKPPKPGARLVLPVKPDLSLLKTVKTNPPKSEGDEQNPTLVLAEDKVDKKEPMKDLKKGSVLQAAKGKLGGSQVNITKLSISKPLLNGGPSLGQSKEIDSNLIRGDNVPEEAESWKEGVTRPSYEEDADREVAELMADGVLPSAMDLHWAQTHQMCEDPQDWLRPENLLPHQTVEKLTKWTVYQDDERAHVIPVHNSKGLWESEDPTQNMLESRLHSTQVKMPGSDQVVEVDEVEDLAQLE